MVSHTVQIQAWKDYNFLLWLSYFRIWQNLKLWFFHEPQVKWLMWSEDPKWLLESFSLL